MKAYTYRIKRRTFTVQQRPVNAAGKRHRGADCDGYPTGWLVIEWLSDGWQREVARGLATLREAKAAAELEARPRL